MKNLIRLSSTLSTALLLATFAHSEVHFVSAGLNTGANNGDSWANAYQGSQGLQSALAVAQAGDQIYVAQGVYKPTETSSRSVYFEWRAGIKIYGGFMGTESSPDERPRKGTAPTILSGDLDDNDTLWPTGVNSLHVVVAVDTDADSLLDRLVIKGGNSNEFSITPTRGGGLYSEQVEAIRIRDCEFIQNYAAGFGAGIAANRGGGAYLSALSVEVLDCEFRGNSADKGGGVYVDAPANARLARNRFYFNFAASEGGAGLYVALGGFVEISHSVIAWNQSFLGASKAGTGIFLDGVASTKIINCTVAMNDENGTSQSSQGFGIFSNGGAT
ncbi:MAG: right-handed parallel beta-helix repeat-containing protein, partial [Planctomycetota bacterium]|nr:right-handed parallel beta-helix repeat-containing protein [Planctomycetota bacterium]